MIFWLVFKLIIVLLTGLGYLVYWAIAIPIWLVVWFFQWALGEGPRDMRGLSWLPWN